MAYTYPGVYINELSSPVHAITGVATSIAAFIGYTPRGIDNRAQAIFSFSDFERLYGGLSVDSELSYAVAQFYQNAPGQQAYVVRVPRTGAAPASAELKTVTSGGLVVSALSSGTWANETLLVDVDQGAPVNLASDTLAFNLTVTNLADQTTERFPGLTLDKSSTNYAKTVINDPDNGSRLVNIDDTSLPNPVAALQVTGVLGSPITIAEVTTAVTVAAAPAVVHNDWDLLLTLGGGPATTVTLLAGGTSVPQSLAGLALRVQQAINAALAVSAPGASATVSVAPVVTDSATPPALGQALRISVSAPGDPGVIPTLAAPSGATPPDALTVLGLASTPGPPAPSFNVAHYALGGGVDGTGLPGTDGLIGDQAAFTGIYALEKVDLFNLLSIPDATRALPSDPAALDPVVDPVAIYSQAIPYCDQRRAFLLVDPPPEVTAVSGAVDWISSRLGITDPNGAAFWPRLRLPDPVNSYKLRTFAPSGVVAGVFATTDGSRGVWKAPAGISATLTGVQGLSYLLTDQENGLLNPLGLNCFRSFPVYGRVLWGARTLQGADAEASQWKYTPVRRLALFLEESLYRGLQWVVFEPNDTLLWAAIRLNVESFLQTYFLKGAFAGTTPAQAYFVKCDSETTTATDVANGVVNVLVGFAPLEPAEFVVIQIEQLAGQATS
jgi:uncharacterized protein